MPQPFQTLFSIRLFGIVACVSLLTIFANSVLAETAISGFDVGKLEFALSERLPEQYSITLHPKGGVKSLSTDLTANVFAISGPSRLVIDIPGITFGVEKKVDLTHPLLEKIRVGSHPDKTRFVIDIRDEAKPAYSVKTDVASESIVINFSITPGETAVDGEKLSSELAASNSVATEKSVAEVVKTTEPDPKIKEPKKLEPEKSTKAKKENAAEDTSDSKNADALLLEAIRAAQNDPAKETSPAKPVDTVNANTKTAGVKPEQVKATPPKDLSSPGDTPAEPGLATTALPDRLPDPVKAESAKAVAGDPANDGSSVVKGISFETLDSNKAVVIEVTNPGVYKLVPQADDRYELKLDATKLGSSHLVIPQFPPEDFQGFDVVMARQTGDAVVIQIYVTKGTKLFPAKLEDRIVIKTKE